jgi:hypothetical protein
MHAPLFSRRFRQDLASGLHQVEVSFRLFCLPSDPGDRIRKPPVRIPGHGSLMSEKCHDLLTTTAFAGEALHTFVCRSAFSTGPSAGRSGPVRWFHPGQSVCIWCGRGDLNPHDLLGSADFHTTSAFAAPLREFVVWTIPSPYPARGLGAAHLVSTPSRKHPGLARDCHSRFPRL